MPELRHGRYGQPQALGDKEEKEATKRGWARAAREAAKVVAKAKAETEAAWKAEEEEQALEEAWQQNSPLAGNWASCGLGVGWGPIKTQVGPIQTQIELKKARKQASNNAARRAKVVANTEKVVKVEAVVEVEAMEEAEEASPPPLSTLCLGAILTSHSAHITMPLPHCPLCQCNLPAPRRKTGWPAHTGLKGGAPGKPLGKHPVTPQQIPVLVARDLDLDKAKEEQPVRYTVYCT